MRENVEFVQKNGFAKPSKNNFMKIEQSVWTAEIGWTPKLVESKIEANLVILFGSGETLRNRKLIEKLRKQYPESITMGCTTSGEILASKLNEQSLVSTAIEFEQTEIRGTETSIKEAKSAYAVGKKLANELNDPELNHIFLLSDGSVVNGSELVRGIHEHLSDHVSVTGGLAGDYYDFNDTYVLFNNSCDTHKVAAVGFYGDHLQVGHGCFGGWDPFGPDRLITRSEGNILYELDDQPALQLYKRYLGEHATELPASGLLFPLSIRKNTATSGQVRTILGVDEEQQSLIFAGDVPEGSYARLMKANNNRLLDGAHDAALEARKMQNDLSPDLALLISCVGRRMVLKQRIEEELEEVSEILGPHTAITGFYSYGEIAPSKIYLPSTLHNQTMCITTFSETKHA